MSHTKKIPKPRIEKRQDGWENSLTGLGVLGRDKRLGTTFSNIFLTQEAAEEIWRGDDIAARVVECVPDEMLREGFELCIPDNRDQAEELEHEARDTGVIESIRTALYYERAYGGAGILLGAKDGRGWDKPLDEASVTSFDFMTVLTPRELFPVKYYADPLKKNYGEIAMYRLIPIDAPPNADIASLTNIHESRIVRFGGIRTSRGRLLRNLLPGWGDSVFIRVAQVINDFQAAWQGAAILMQDFAPGVLKIEGLAKLLASQNTNDKSLAVRAKAIAQARSIANTTIIDAKEEYERKTVSVNGLADLLDKMMLRMAAAASMPVSLLMGQSPAGLNATGDADVRWFFNHVSALQERYLRPPLAKILRLLMFVKGGVPKKWDFKFNPLWQLTELEQSELRKNQAEADQIYVVNQVTTPQEIAASRFSGDYSTETQIDHDLREEIANPDDHAVQLGAGVAEDKKLEQQNAAKAAAKPVAKPGGSGA